MELAMKISKDVRKLWRDFCAKNSSSAPCAVTERGINEILDDVEALETALSAVPETGAQGLTDAELVSWIDENWLKFSSDGKYCRAASEAGCRAMFYAFRTWLAARAVARRGMVTLDEVEKAIVGVWVEGGHNNLPDFVAATRAGLTAKSTKQERVTVVGAVVYLDGKEFAVFKGHDSNCPAEKYAAGLRQELEETK